MADELREKLTDYLEDAHAMEQSRETPTSPSIWR
jgi:hypothetical protein